MAHELCHVRNYDIRFSLMVGVLVGSIALLADFFLRFTFWGGGRRSRRDSDSGGGGGLQIVIFAVAIVLAILAPIVARLVQLAVSRQREYLADASGVELTRNPFGLERALAKITLDTEPLEVANRATQHLYFDNPIKAATGGSRACSRPIRRPRPDQPPARAPGPAAGRGPAIVLGLASVTAGASRPPVPPAGPPAGPPGPPPGPYPQPGRAPAVRANGNVVVARSSRIAQRPAVRLPRLRVRNGRRPRGPSGRVGGQHGRSRRRASRHGREPEHDLRVVDRALPLERTQPVDPLEDGRMRREQPRRASRTRP